MMRVIAGSARGVPLKAPTGAGTRPTTDKVRGAIFDALALDLAEARVLDLYAGTGALGIEALSRGAATCLFIEKAGAVCRVIEANLRATKLSAGAKIWRLSVETALKRLMSQAEELADLNRLMSQAEEVAAPNRPMSQAEGVAALNRPMSVARPVVPRGQPASPQTLPSPPLPRRERGSGGEGFSLDSTFLPPYDVIILDPPYADPTIAAVIERVGGSSLVAPGGLVVLEHGKRFQPPSEPGVLRPRRTRRYGDTVVTIWQREEDGEA